ncbi:hypothetical protein ABWI01_05385 [Oceanicaulis alexandrii]|uniref:hypothetical protein n=1 Tax=Oceanicaulis alexandrii TaxID=153233 RepID=UPI0035CE8A4B
MNALASFIKRSFNNFASGVVFVLLLATIVLFFSRVSLDYVGEYQMSFADLSAILLTAAAVLITVFGLALAIMGLVGWDTLKRAAIEEAVSAAREAAKTPATEEAIKQVQVEMSEGGKLWHLMGEYVDDLIYSDTRGDKTDFPNPDDEHGGE